MNKITLGIHTIVIIAVLISTALLFMILRETRIENQRGGDAEYFHECYEAFIKEFPLTKYKGTSEEYAAEARKACP